MVPVNNLRMILLASGRLIDNQIKGYAEEPTHIIAPYILILNIFLFIVSLVCLVINMLMDIELT
jgi:hypothetical protein